MLPHRYSDCPDLPWRVERSPAGSTRHHGASMDTALVGVSLGFGLLATVVLAVSVAASYWLHTVEPYDIGPLFIGGGGGGGPGSVVDGPTEELFEEERRRAVGSDNSSSDSVEEEEEEEEEEEMETEARGAFGGGGVGRLITLSTHSGLWKACVSTVSDQFVHQDPLSESEEYYENEVDANPCSYIDYFGQGFERIEGGETSVAILRGIRKATPVILVSMVLMTVAEVLSIVGYCRRDYRTIVGGIVSIVSALSLVLGQIFYISVVNDEVSQWKRPEGAGDGHVFGYSYGWAFYAASSSFLCSMTAAVGQITLFLRRYSGSVRDMVFVVPGLDTKKLAAAATAETSLSTAAVLEGCAAAEDEGGAEGADWDRRHQQKQQQKQRHHSVIF